MEAPDSTRSAEASRFMWTSGPHIRGAPLAHTASSPDPDGADAAVMPIHVTGKIRVTATAYDNCPICTGKASDHPAFGITSSGVPAMPERTIAVDPRVIPIGSWVYVDGLGVYRAEDTGGAIQGNRIDIFMPTHEEALEFGIQEFDIFLVRQTF